MTRPASPPQGNEATRPSQAWPSRVRSAPTSRSRTRSIVSDQVRYWYAEGSREALKHVHCGGVLLALNHTDIVAVQTGAARELLLRQTARVRVADGATWANSRHLPGDEVWLVGELRPSGERKYHLSNLPPQIRLSESLQSALLQGTM